MDLEFAPEEQAFRAEVNDFLMVHLPRGLRDKVRTNLRLSREDLAQWHSILSKQGWLAAHWPVPFGGPGWSVVQRFIFETECALAYAPRIVPFGVNMLGPVLIKYGSDAQKAHWLPRILNGEDWWCQGYSEPGAGSDLAAVATTAERQGDSYVVNGQKTWTTLAHFANMIFCLVRTQKGLRPQSGISFLLIDLHSPGVEVRPITTLDGEHEVNEVFFTNVKVPIENLVGEEHHGWTIAKYLLTYERTNLAGIGLSIAALRQLKGIAGNARRHGQPLTRDPLFAARLARVEIDLQLMQTTNLRVMSSVEGGGAPGPESSMLKIRGTEIRQEISSLMRRAVGSDALRWDELTADMGLADAEAGSQDWQRVTVHYLNSRKLSIFGGSNEIQKNIVAKMVLGL